MARVSAQALINFAAPIHPAFIRDPALIILNWLNINNLGKSLSMWNYNITMESLFHIESSYAVIQSKIFAAKALQGLKHNIIMIILQENDKALRTPTLTSGAYMRPGGYCFRNTLTPGAYMRLAVI